MIKKGMFIGNRYEVLDKVGSGGMSDVYKAKDHKLNRFVAIKVLKHEFSKDKNFVSKFRVEAQSAARLEHTNIVNVYDVGEDAGLYYIVMELVEGITLKQYIARKKRLSVKEATSIAIQIAQGIECAHNNQIVHRDIKPQNIIISTDGKVKVKGLDVGTYHFKEITAPEGYSVNQTPVDATLEVTDKVKGADGKVNKVLTAETSMTDTKLSALPSTGGMGTYLFTIIGVVVMVGAAGAFFISRRRESEE